MTFPVMPTQPPKFMNAAQAADYAHSNYIQLMSGLRTSGSSSTFGTRAARTELVSNEFTSSLGQFNMSAPRPPALADGCTILFFGGRDSAANANISGATVNGNSISITPIYNDFANNAASFCYSCYIGYTRTFVYEISSVAANFPVGGGSDILNSSAIYVLAGRWTAGPVTAITTYAASGTIAISANELVAFSSWTASDVTAAAVNFPSGALIATNKTNWYDGIQHGLLYRTNSGNVTIAQNYPDSTLRMFKLTYSP